MIPRCIPCGPLGLLTLALGSLLFSGAASSQGMARPIEPQPIGEPARDACALWLRQAAVEPEAYVVSKFDRHDLVMLGETHELRQNCEFVATLVPKLYAAGVRTLCSEFIASRHNQRLARIVSDKTYDETAVVDLFRGGPWPTWGYKEYMDIVRAVWSLNQGLAAGAEPFRMVGVDSDWRQIDILTKGTAERMKIVLAREEHMVSVIEGETFGQRAKALLHIGFAHTARQGKRVAARLAQKHGDRLFQVCMHHDMPGVGGASGRFTGFIEEVAAAAQVTRAGFDVAGTPMASLRDDQGQYFRMLGNSSTFQDFAQGYVFLGRMRDLRPVSWMKGFITPQTFEEAREVAERLRWVGKGKCTTPEQLNAALAARLLRRSQNTSTPAANKATNSPPE